MFNVSLVNKRGSDNALGYTDFKKKEVKIFKKSHGKNKKREKNRLINTIAHEIYHTKHPNATEREVYKKTSATKVKNMSRNQKQRLYNKIY